MLKSLLLLLVVASAAAQAPTPFAGLNTTQTDLTSDPLHTPWYVANPISGNPGTYSGPAEGGTILDRTFGTLVHRPPRPTDCSPSIGPCSTQTQGFNLIYSKVDPWSRDNSRWLVEDDTGWLYVYDATTDPYTFRERLQVDAATRAFATNAGQIATDFSNVVWCKTSGCGTKAYYTGSVSNSSTGRNALMLFDEATYTATLVHDFTATIALYPGCTSVDSRREGNQSDDDRYWFLDCTDAGGADYGYIVYDKTLDSVIATKGKAAGAMCGAGACTTEGANWTGVCPSGNYFMVNWNDIASRPNTLTRGHGTEIFDKELNFLGWADIGNSHADCGYTSDGKEVYVTVPYAAFRYDSNAIAITDLSNLSTTIPTGNTWAPGERVVGLPCNWNYTGPSDTCPAGGDNIFRSQPYTISMRGSHGTQQGAMMFSSFQTSSNPNGSGGWGTNENIIIMLNYATAYQTPGDGVGSYPVAPFYRVGWTHAVHAQSRGNGDSGDYFAQADGVCNWDSTKCAFTSTGDIDNGTDGTPDEELPVNQARHMALYVNLPIAAPTLTTITVTPNPGSILVGGTLTESATCSYSAGSPELCSVTWTNTSNHSSINTTTGVVTATTVGTDTITATINSIFGTATVTISAPMAMTGVQASGHLIFSGSLSVGKP